MPSPRLRLTTEGDALFHTGGVQTWSRELIRSLPDHDVQVVAFMEPGQGSARSFPAFPWNVVAAQVVRPGARLLLHSRLLHSRPSPRQGRAFGSAFGALLECAGSAPAPSQDRFLEGVLGLAELSEHAALGPLLIAPPARRALHHVLRSGPGGAGAREVAAAARWLRGVLTCALHPLPPSPAVLSVGTGAGALSGVVARHRQGARLIQVEHTVALRERLLWLHAVGGSPALHRLRAQFYEAVSRAAHASAHVVVTGCVAHAGWHTRLGAVPERLVVFPPEVQATPHGTVVRAGGATVGYLGRLDPLKNLETLIEAFARVRQALPHARLLLYGPTPPGNAAYRADLHRLVRRLRLGSAVTFGGPSADVDATLRGFDVTVLPSVSEGVPYVLLEAMMAGQAIVASRVGGIPETLGEAGVLVTPQDVGAVARATERLLRSPAERARLGSLARHRALGRSRSAQAPESRYRRVIAPGEFP